MITLTGYWMGRDVKYRAELTADIIANAQITVDRVNQALQLFFDETGIDLNDDHVASGWRPRGVNAATANAAKGSRHLTGEGCDIRDTAERQFARWCLKNYEQLEAIGLWMEDPQWTPTWVHLQIRPPKSGRRIYVPSDKPAIVAKLVEQGGAA